MNLAHAHDVNDLFVQVKARFEARNRSGLVCKQGQYKNCCVLKLQKPSWTNDPMYWIQNQSGIFFSVWDDQRSRGERVSYNIHALKLRKLAGYAITSRDFASDFRARFETQRHRWPNVSVNFGPATLMQGWIAKKGAIGKNILTLMEDFTRVSPIIDDLLASRRRSTSTRA